MQLQDKTSKGLSKKPRKPINWPGVIILFVFVAFFAGGVAVTALFVANLETDEEPRRVCGTFAQEQNLRQIIADNTLASQQSEGEIVTYTMALPCLPSNAFIALSPQEIIEQQNIDQLAFNGNGLKNIDVEAFNISQVRSFIDRLSFANNNLRSVSSDLFETFLRIDVLDLSNNNLQQFTMEKFVSMSTLLLNNNDLRSVPQLANVASITTLNLAGNRNLNLEANVFASFVGLQVLDLQDIAVLEGVNNPREFLNLPVGINLLT